MEQIQVILQPEDFKDSDFSNAQDCPLTRATRRYFPEGTFVGVGYTSVVIGRDVYAVVYPKEGFLKSDYNRLKAKAERGGLTLSDAVVLEKTDYKVYINCRITES